MSQGEGPNLQENLARMCNKGDSPVITTLGRVFRFVQYLMTASFSSCGTVRSFQITARRRELALTPSFNSSSGRLSCPIALALAIRLSTSTTFRV